ncbi:MAG: hypothetical protein HYW65_01445 [Candidatus Liptonbacteria bacterium]|nr:hypothetical protein [Candidatus Liptonbacteria bacterium]
MQELTRTELEDFILSLAGLNHVTLFAETSRIGEMVARIRGSRMASARPKLQTGDTISFGQIEGNVVFTMKPEGKWRADATFIRREGYRGEALLVEWIPEENMWMRTTAARAPIGDNEQVAIIEVLDAPLE